MNSKRYFSLITDSSPDYNIVNIKKEPCNSVNDHDYLQPSGSNDINRQINRNNQQNNTVQREQPSVLSTIDFDVQDMLRRPEAEYYDNVVVGDKRKEALERERALTTLCLKNLLARMATMPTDAVDKDPRGLTVPLIEYQKKSLKWMQYCEKQDPSGGILGNYLFKI